MAKNLYFELKIIMIVNQRIFNKLRYLNNQFNI